MGILLIARGLGEPSTLWMRRQLRALGKHVSVLATDRASSREFGHHYRTIVLRRDSHPLLDRVLRALTVAQISVALRRRLVSEVLVHYATDAVMYRHALRSAKVPVFVHCHGYDVTWKGYWHRPKSPMHRADYVEKVQSLPSNVSFIANSKGTAAKLRDIGIPQDRTFLKYLGVEVPTAPVARAGKTSGLVVLYLGRLIDCKGPDMVIQAFDAACEKGFQGKLIVAGDGPLDVTCELLRAHSQYRDRIELLGAVDAARGDRLRREADIFTAHNCIGAISGQEEAFGVTIVEAMAAGLPVVNAANGSVPEIIEDGREGILVEPGDSEAHANAFVRLGMDPKLRARMGRDGWARARDQFSLELEIRKLKEILAQGRSNMGFADRRDVASSS